MSFHFLPGQNYDCVRCAKGCKTGLRVLVDPYARRKLEGSLLELRVIQDYQEPIVAGEDGQSYLTHKPNGHCVLLQEDEGLCSIHAEMGIEAKPIICRTFPFSIVPTPDGYYVGASFLCTAVQQNRGRPLAEHQGEVEAILEGVRFTRVGDEPVAVWEQAVMEWSTYRELEAQLDEAVVGANRPEQGVAVGLTRLAPAIGTQGLITSAMLVSPLRDQITGNYQFQVQTDLLVASLVGFMEAPEPQAVQSLTRAILEGAPLALPRWSWSGTTQQLDLTTSDFDEEIRRYLRALLFSKHLVTHRPIWINLGVLYLLPPVLRFYTGLMAAVRGAERPELEDYFRALDVVERDLATHASGIEPLLRVMAEAYLTMLSVPAPPTV